AMNFVDEEHLVFTEAREDRRQISWPLEDGPSGRAYCNAELLTDDMRQGGFAEAGRPVKQHVVECLAALPRGRDRHVKVRAHPLLTDVVVERARAQPRFV